MSHKFTKKLLCGVLVSTASFFGGVIASEIESSAINTNISHIPRSGLRREAGYDAFKPGFVMGPNPGVHVVLASCRNAEVGPPIVAFNAVNVICYFLREKIATDLSSQHDPVHINRFSPRRALHVAIAIASPLCLRKQLFVFMIKQPGCHDPSLKNKLKEGVS